MDMHLRRIGTIQSTIKTRENAPKMETEEGAVRAEIVIEPEYAEAMRDLKPGNKIELFTWFHLSDRSVQKCHPRGDKSRPQRGIFDTRSPDRPNPIGLHRVTIVSVDGMVLTVEPLEALDGTPVIDIKPQP